MTHVKVDAENLWYILQQYRAHLDNQCGSGTDLEVHRKYGFYFQEYEIIKKMKQQIQENSNMTRKLVTVRTIDNILPIKDADMIEQLVIGGW